MKSKKLLVINLITLITFVLIIGIGINQANPNQDAIVETDDDLLKNKEETHEEPVIEDDFASKEEKPVKTPKQIVKKRNPRGNGVK